jgi:hypothetical protein
VAIYLLSLEEVPTKGRIVYKVNNYRPRSYPPRLTSQLFRVPTNFFSLVPLCKAIDISRRDEAMKARALIIGRDQKASLSLHFVKEGDF